MLHHLFIYTRDGVFLDISQGGAWILQFKSTIRYFPQFGSSAIFNGTLSNDMKIGHSVTDLHSISKWNISSWCNVSRWIMMVKFKLSLF